MGLGIPRYGRSKCKAGSVPSDSSAVTSARDLGQPDPAHFKILRYFTCNNGDGWHTVVEVSYPDAKNYEGRKIMLYKREYSVIAEQQYLDPHFCDDASHISPFARFEPTEAGWAAAIKMAASK